MIWGGKDGFVRAIIDNMGVNRTAGSSAFKFQGVQLHVRAKQLLFIAPSRRSRITASRSVPDDSGAHALRI